MEIRLCWVSWKSSILHISSLSQKRYKFYRGNNSREYNWLIKINFLSFFSKYNSENFKSFFAYAVLDQTFYKRNDLEGQSYDRIL